MPNTNNKPKIIFDFVRPPVYRLEQVKKGLAPRESLLGYIQLAERGWPINKSDERWNSKLGLLRKKLAFNIEIPSISMIKKWNDADIIVVVTRISLILTIVAKLLKKKIIFLDALCEEVPNRLWRRIVIKLSLEMADGCVCLSTSQADHWAKQLSIPREVFIPVNYGIDLDFYTLSDISNDDSNVKPYLLSVGRDPRRDFNSALMAANELGWELKIVTQSYLVPENVKNSKNVQISENLSYSELFKLYAKAAVVVVPVKIGTTYMSGIRATMEAMLLGKPVVASRVSGMEDYFVDQEDLIYFQPENYKDLIKAVNAIKRDKSVENNLIANARQSITNKYSVSQYVDSLEKIFLSL